MGTVSVSPLLPEDPSSERPVAPGGGRGTRGGRSGRSRENTRERLLEAAVEVFVGKGLKRVTVDDLTKAAGFTRGAFYSNFDSVDEVFFEVFRMRARSLLARANDEVEAAEVVDIDFVLALMQGMSADRDWLVLQSEFALLALRDDEARALFAEFVTELRSDLSAVIEDVLERLGRRPTLPPAQLAQVVVGLQNQLASATALGHFGPEQDGGDAAEQVARQVLAALITEFSEPAEG